jgi:hypothetical protein
MKKQVIRGPSERLKVGSGISEQRLKVFTLISVDEPCTSKFTASRTMNYQRMRVTATTVMAACDC